MCTIYYSILYIMPFDVYIICTYKYISSITYFEITYTIEYTIQYMYNYLIDSINSINSI